jgi:hypothetical protein
MRKDSKEFIEELLSGKKEKSFFFKGKVNGKRGSSSSAESMASRGRVGDRQYSWIPSHEHWLAGGRSFAISICARRDFIGVELTFWSRCFGIGFVFK